MKHFIFWISGFQWIKSPEELLKNICVRPCLGQLNRSLRGWEARHLYIPKQPRYFKCETRLKQMVLYTPGELGCHYYIKCLHDHLRSHTEIIPDSSLYLPPNSSLILVTISFDSVLGTIPLIVPIDLSTKSMNCLSYNLSVTSLDCIQQWPVGFSLPLQGQETHCHGTCSEHPVHILPSPAMPGNLHLSGMGD